MISPSGYVTTIAGTGRPGYRDGTSLFDNNGIYDESVAEFTFPSSIVVWKDWQWWPYENPIDPDTSLYENGNGRMVLFIADTGNHRIRKITGSFDLILDENEGNGSTGERKILRNVSVECFSGRCNHRENNQSEKFRTESGYSDGTRYESRFDSPRGIDVNFAGDVFVADTNNHLIRKIDRWGTATTLAGSLTVAEKNSNKEPLEGCPPPCLMGILGHDDGPLMESKFSYPSDIAVGKNQPNGDSYEIFITDRHHLRRITMPVGTVETLAGDSREGESDGQGKEASFNKPSSISYTPDGYLYIADATSCRIRRSASPQLLSQSISCSDRLSDIFRPAECSSYNSLVDKFGLKTTPVSGNTFFNFLNRKQSHTKLGDHFIGRRLKECIGSPPQKDLDKKYWNNTSPNYPYNLNLVIDDGKSEIREDPNHGTLIKVSCPTDCHDNIDSKAYGWKIENQMFYTENSSICSAAIHSGIINSSGNLGGMIDVITDNEVLKESLLKPFQFTPSGGEETFVSTDHITSGHLFRVSLSPDEFGIQTISGSPSNLLGQPCGHFDGTPPQESKVIFVEFQIRLKSIL